MAGMIVVKAFATFLGQKRRVSSSLRPSSRPSRSTPLRGKVITVISFRVSLPSTDYPESFL